MTRPARLLLPLLLLLPALLAPGATPAQAVEPGVQDAVGTVGSPDVTGYQDQEDLFWVRWSFPQPEGLVRVVVRSATGEQAPASPGDGDPVELGDDRSATGATVLRLAPAEVRAVAVFGLDAQGLAGPAGTVVLRQPTTSPWPVWQPRSSAGSISLALGFTPPRDPGFAGARAGCAPGEVAPEEPSSALVGPTSTEPFPSFVFRDLQPGTAYSCAIWSYDAQGTRSDHPVLVRQVTRAAPPAATRLTASATTGSTCLSWVDLPWPARDHVAVRVAEGLVPPPYALAPGLGRDLDTRSVFTAADKGICLELPPGRDHTFAVWGVDDQGATSAPAVVTTRASRLALGTGRTTTTYGSPVTTAGALTLLDGTPLPGVDVVVWARTAGAADFRPVTHGLTDALGRVALSWRPTGTSAVQLRSRDVARAVGSSSTTTAVTVRARVALAAPASAVPRGRAVVLRGAVAPRPVGTAVSVQRFDGRAWRTVVVARTTTAGGAFAGRVVAAAGTFRYRALVAADGRTAANLSAEVRLRGL